MLKKKKSKIYNFNYTIYWKNGNTTIGEVTDSYLTPAEIFLSKKMTYFNSGKGYYYNLDEINQIEVTNLEEKEKE